MLPGFSFCRWDCELQRAQGTSLRFKKNAKIQTQISDGPRSSHLTTQPSLLHYGDFCLSVIFSLSANLSRCWVDVHSCNVIHSCGVTLWAVWGRDVPARKTFIRQLLDHSLLSIPPVPQALLPLLHQILPNQIEKPITAHPDMPLSGVVRPQW